MGRLSNLRLIDSEMRVGIITPAPAGSNLGNRVTALRWAHLLKDLGHQVYVKQEYAGESFDLLVGLHARRSYESIKRFHEDHPQRPLIVALSGTDLYHDLPRSNRRAQQSLEFATRIVALQPKAQEELEPRLRYKVRVIYQSVSANLAKRTPRYRTTPARGKHSAFDVCVVGHLRPVKDPFRAALAARLLPRTSRIRIVHVGGAMTPAMEARAIREMELNPRYRWIGDQPRARTYAILARSNLCVLSSKMEGGANVLSEAIVASVPIVASRIPGTVGILGDKYPGYFDVGMTRELAELMIQAETDAAFLQGLLRRGRQLADHFSPITERKAWVKLLNEL